MGRDAIRARLADGPAVRHATVEAFGETLTVRQLTFAEMEDAQQGAFRDTPDVPGARTYSWLHHRLAMLVLATTDADGHRVFDNSAEDLAQLENGPAADINAVLVAVLSLNGFDAAIEEARAKLFGGSGAGAQSSASPASMDASSVN